MYLKLHMQKIRNTFLLVKVKFTIARMSFEGSFEFIMHG